MIRDVEVYWMTKSGQKPVVSATSINEDEFDSKEAVKSQILHEIVDTYEVPIDDIDVDKLNWQFTDTKDQELSKKKEQTMEIKQEELNQLNKNMEHSSTEDELFKNVHAILKGLQCEPVVAYHAGCIIKAIEKIGQIDIEDVKKMIIENASHICG